MIKSCGIPQQDTAVGFYRIVQPLRFMKREGIVQESRMIPFSGNLEMQKLQFNDRVLMEIAKDADYIHTTIMWHDDDLRRMLNLRKWSGAKWIVDVDDNMYAVSMDNPAYAGLQQVLPKIERCLQFADGLTVTVANLEKLYKPLNQNVFINPNGIDFSWWDNYRVKRHKGIRIGWRGAQGHKHDLELARPALEAIKRDYPDVTVVIFSQYKPKFDFEYEHHDWVGFADYPEKLASLNLDIAIVPLVDSSYNRCKSNLNYLENTALKIPCVLSPTENQRLVPGLYATSNHEWYKALSSLIEDSKYRKVLGEQGYNYTKDHFDMKRLVKPLAEWIEALPYRTDIEPESFDKRTK